MKLSSLNKGLVAHYPLDKESLQSATTFADKTPYENVGTKYGSVLKFDGGNDYVSVADNASLDITDAITVSAWVKLTNFDNDLAAIVSKAAAGNGFSLEKKTGENRIAFAIGDGDGFIQTASDILTADVWYHIVGTNDGTNIRIYNNGVLKNTAAQSGPASAASNVKIGLHGTIIHASRYFNGDIGDTRIYSRALTAAEVLTMYQGGVVSDTDLEAHYKFGDKSGTTLTDETANNNDGTLTNFADTTAEYGNTHDSGWVTDDTPNVFALDRMGQADRAMSFDGESDYVDCGNDTSLNITDEITISAWVKINTINTRKTILHRNYGTYDMYMEFQTGNYLYYRIKTSDNGNVVLSGNKANFATDQWYHIIYKYDGSNLISYVDGIYDNQIACTGTIITISNDDVIIGMRGSAYHDLNFDGTIADVRIYNRALDQTEITMLYDMYRPKLSAGSLQKGLVFDMPLTSTYTKDETAGAEVMTDRTPYSNDGQNSGGDVDTDHTTFVAANSDNVRIADSASLSPTSTMTAMVWVKGGVQSGRGILTHYDYGNNQRSFMLSTATDKFEVFFADDGTTSHMKQYNSSIVAFDSTWHLIGFSFDAGTLKLFVDGVEDTNPTKVKDDAITTIHNSTADFMVGCYLSSDTPAAFFNGDISGAKVWNRALSSTEIKLLYEAKDRKIVLSQPIYGVEWDQSANTYARTGAISDEAMHSSPGDTLLPIHAKMRRCVMNDAGVVQYYLDPTDSTKKENGEASDLTGGDGQVMVEIPKFYYKQGFAGTTHTWEICGNHRPYFELHPAFIKDGAEVDYRYIGAYEGSMWDATTSAMVAPADIITNMYASGDKLCSISAEYPKTNEMRSEFRTMASERGAGWRQLDFDLNSAVQLLYIIEYADFDSQTEIGYGRTQLSGGSWVAGSYIGQCGKSNGDGDGTNSVAGNTNDAYMTYRGIENWYGNVWKWNDGININDHVPYVTNNASAWADDTATGYTDLGVTLPAANNYQITLADTDRGFLPASVGASTTYISDYYYQNTGWRVVRLGGSARSSASAGAFCMHAVDAASVDYVELGGRLSR